MAPAPELFVVCKSCGSEVSPYITECPYCGARLRKRAPKIERERPAKPSRRMAKPTLGPLRAGEIPGISADPLRRPYVTIGLIAMSIFGLLAALIFTPLSAIALAFEPTGAAWWKAFTSPFIYVNLWYQLAAVLAIGIFGWRLERRDGPLVVVGLFLVCGIGAVALASALRPSDVAIGGNGAALGLLAFWAVPELIRERRHLDRDSDLIGTAVIAAVVLAMPAATHDASAIAGVAGLLAGALLGLLPARSVARL